MTSILLPVTQDALDDQVGLMEAIDVRLAQILARHPHERYENVWDRGYWAALEDIRSGRLVLVDGHFKAGPL